MSEPRYFMTTSMTDLAAIEASLKEPGVLVPVSGWRSIDTAPRDGTMVLLHCRVDGSIWFARWASFGWYGVDEFGLRRDAFAERIELDAWQPLPPAPNPQPEQERVAWLTPSF